MANIILNRKNFEKEIGKKIDKHIEEKISLFGTPLERVTDEEIEIEIFPNRPDLLSFQNYVSSFKQFLGKNPGMRKYEIVSPEKNYKVKIDSSVKDIWPYAVCAIVKGLKLNEENIKEIIKIQEKLTLTLGRKRKKLGLGVYPLNKIKLPITYKALEPDKIIFQPLGSEKEMDGLGVLQKHPTGIEYAHLLSGKAKFPIFIDDNEEILSMPPIINSEKTGRITEETKDVFIECTGKDLDVLKKALNIFVISLAEIGGKIYQMEIKNNSTKKEIKTPDLTPEKFKISLENVNKLLGLNLKENEIKKYLEVMGNEYKNKEVLIPSWRTDILHEVDLIEEIAIAYGYNNFESKIPEIATIGSKNKKSEIKSKIIEILNSLGFMEISSYHLVKKDEIKKSGIKLSKIIETEDSKTDYKILRPNLKISLFRTLSENVDAEYPQKIFEIGTIFFKKQEKEKTKIEIKEIDKLIVATTPGNFTEIKQALDYLGKMLSLEFSLEKSNELKEFISGRVAAIMLNKKRIGFIGEIHPNTLRRWHLKMPLTIFEISLNEIYKSLITK